MDADRPTLLLVDDDQGLLTLLGYIFVDVAVCLTASDGQQALDLLEVHAVDAVVLDVMMPNVDGFEVLERIRRDDRLRDLPVVILTARTGEDWRAQTARMGADSHFEKPYDPDRLVAEVDVLLAMTGDERRTRRADALAPLRPL